MGDVAPSTDKWLRHLPRLQPKMLVTSFSAQVSYLPTSLGREGGRKEARDYMVSAMLQPFHFLDLSPSMLSMNEV